MYFKLCWIFILLLSADYFVQSFDNYPAETLNPKPCAKLKNTIAYQNAICVDDGHGGFEPDSRKNCEDSFRLTCPEFNQGECLWYGNRPCCRLKYKATGYTWMEIYYSMQYNREDYDGEAAPYDIIEIHRRIKKHADFGKRDQQDWPNNVLDPKGARGVTWHYLHSLPNTQSGPVVLVDPNFYCLKGQTDSCTNILEYVSEHFPEGFDPKNHKFKLNTNEKEYNAEVRTTRSESRCIRVLLNRTVVGACQVIYSRVAVTILYTTSIPFLEVNFFRDPTHYQKDKPYEIPLFARYTYYNQEDPEMRDQLFAFPTPLTTTAKGLPYDDG